MKVEAYLDSRHPTSILHIKPSNGDVAELEYPLFVWIPGNPGLVEYYEEMLQMIHERNPHWEILGISHAGMSPDNILIKKGVKSSTIYSLEEQILHKIEIINKFSSPGRPLMIMGHSVGAYMAQKVVISETLIGRVIKLGMLTPTIVNIHTSEKGLIFTKAFRCIKNLPQLAAWISGLLFNKIVPKSLIKPILSIIMGCNKDNRAINATTLLLCHSEFVLQVLGLAQYEMETIRDNWEFQENLIDHCRERDISIWLLFSDADHWVSHETRRQLISFYKEAHRGAKVSIQVSSFFPHSFVVGHAKYVVDNYF